MFALTLTRREWKGCRLSLAALQIPVRVSEDTLPPAQGDQLFARERP